MDFFLRTTPEIAESFLSLEQVICHHFLPRLVPNDVEKRSLFALPAHLGGLGIFNPPEIPSTTYQFSRRLAGPIVECVLQQLKSLSPHVFDRKHAIFHDLIKNKRQALTDAAMQVYTLPMSI